jgi:hypothetical protein
MARLRARLITDRRSAPWLLLPMLVVALAGCSVRLIQPYDEVIEKTVTDFYEDFLRFTTTIGRTRGTCADNRGFYDEWQQAEDIDCARDRGKPRGKVSGHRKLRWSAPARCHRGASRDAPAGERADRSSAGRLHGPSSTSSSA